jgi:precorrin-8X/cobalt-precorrin-8 methylmutase
VDFSNTDTNIDTGENPVSQVNGGLDYKSGTAKGRNMSQRSFNIERQSFDIIESEVGNHGYTDDQWAIVRRVIHATADFDFAKGCKIVFHRKAIESAFLAISRKSFIVSDVEMVLHGINKRLLSEMGMEGVCYINDPECIEDSKKLNRTRSELAMHKAIDKINDGIVVIGNAPTALYQLISLINEKKVKPLLVVGIPVGFVSAVESKSDLMNLDIPFITNHGRKGGSSAASSIVNALLLLYSSKSK